MTEKKQGRRSAQTAQETKQQILEVAISLFCEHGFEQVSIRNISEAAGVSHSLIRHHFGNKEQIWYAASDSVGEYMHSYVSKLISDIDTSLPANQRLYHFNVRLLAHFLLEPRPIQFAANLVRQDDKFMGYFIDSHEEIEKAVTALIDNYNALSPAHSLTLWEQKWLLFSNAHAAHSLKPLLKEVWKEQVADHQACLLKHWQLFNLQMSLLLNIEESKRIQPDNLNNLVLTNIDCCGEGTN